MLFVIDTSIAAATADAEPALRQVLEDLARAHRSARHFVVAERRVAAAIRAAAWLSADGRGTWAHIEGRASEVAAWAEAVAVRVVVYAGDQPPQRSEQEIRVGHRWLYEAEWVAGSVLIVEAINDRELMTPLTDALRPRERRGVRSWWVPDLAGGGNAVHVLRAAQERRQMYLAVLDSDRSAPDAPLGSTAYDAKKVWDAGQINHLHILEARELENLLPAPLVQAVADQVGDRGLIDRVQRQTHLLGEAGAPWADLKAQVWADMLGRVVEHLRGLSPGKNAEAFAQAGPNLRELAELAMAWGLAPRDRLRT